MRLSKKSVGRGLVIAIGICLIAGEARTQTKAGPPVIEHPVSPDEQMLHRWLSSNGALSGDVRVTKIRPGEPHSVVGEGRVEVHADGVVHYRLSAPSHESPARDTATKGESRATASVEFWRRESVVVIRAPEDHLVRLSLDDCLARARVAGSGTERTPKPTPLLAALGGDSPLARESAVLASWILLIGDPRHTIPPNDEYDLTGFSGSASPTLSTTVELPAKFAGTITDAISATAVALNLEWTEKHGVQSASFSLHSSDNPHEVGDSRYFDAYITFWNLSDSPFEPPPSEVLKQLVSEGATK